MIPRLYHCLDARSFRPLWTLEEMGLEYTLHMLPFPPRAFAKEFKEINPLGTIPAFIDEQGLMTESAAICQYLVTRHGPSSLAVSSDEADYGAWLQWLHFGEATLTFPQTLLLRYGKFEPVERRQPQVVEDYSAWFLARLRAVDRALTGKVTGKEYLCAGRFTVADISVGYALLLAESLGFAKDFSPAIAAFWQRLQARPAYQKAQQAQQEAGGKLGLLSPVK